jgi:LmbE family N-acetylglucosaminyl deacetylase
MFHLLVTASVYVLFASAGEGTLLDQVRYQTNTASRQVVLVAHQDDWQLFMGDVIAGRIHAGDSVIFVYVTAGDDGRDSSYWLTRERAALQSTLVAVGQGAVDHSSVQCAMTRVLSHSLRKCSVGKTESYFLRLPDGRRNGAGFAEHRYQSLRKLRSNQISAITAIDGSATYNGWNDLARTVSVLIGPQTVAFPVTVHATDPSKAINPHDHFDHRMVGLIVYDLRKSQSLGTKFYVGYAVATRAANRTTDQARMKEQLFLAYDQEMMRTNKTWSAYAEHPAFYSQCIVRTYARTVGTAAHP